MRKTWRRVCLCMLLSASSQAFAGEPLTFPDVVPGYTLRFPQDEGSHPEFRLEWWYVTGWLDTAGRDHLGFQVTFFRTRPERIEPGNPSRFNPAHIFIAHAALSDPKVGKLLHDQKIARAGFGLADAKIGQAHVWIGDWKLTQNGNRYATEIKANAFSLALTFEAKLAPLLNGDRGFSQKGPNPKSASYYYSIPQLAVSGKVTRRGRTDTVSGTAWFDHEWSSKMMDSRAVGWDWTGLNFNDGSALMAFRMRGKNGDTFWAGGTYRSADRATTSFLPGEIAFTPLRYWRSPKTGTRYPVACQVRAGPHEFILEPLLDDQELDSRPSSRAVYWEGAVKAFDGDKQVARGYLELTGYARALKLD